MSFDVDAERKYKNVFSNGDLVRVINDPVHVGLVKAKGHPTIVGDITRWAYLICFTDGHQNWLTHDAIELLAPAKRNHDNDEP